MKYLQFAFFFAVLAIVAVAWANAEPSEDLEVAEQRYGGGRGFGGYGGRGFGGYGGRGFGGYGGRGFGGYGGRGGGYRGFGR